MDAIPKALSRPQARYTLRSTSLTTKSLHSLLSLRGPWRTNAANGAFTVFADAVAEGDPLDPRLPESVPPKGQVDKENAPETEDAVVRKQQQNRPRRKGLSDPEQDTVLSKKRKRTVTSRFGTAGLLPPPPRVEIPVPPAAREKETTHTSPTIQTEPAQGTTSAALDRLQVYLKDPPFPSSAPSATPPPESPSSDTTANDDQHQKTTVSLTFAGTDVVAGLRRLAELGAIDASRMPSWMTGEEGVSSVAVKGGKRVRLKAEMEDE